MASRNDLFQQVKFHRHKELQMLKPHCVALSQIALRLDKSSDARKDVIKYLESVLEVLRSKARGNANLDGKLADYVFFPLSHVLRQKEYISQRALELSLLCLRILLSDGWRTTLPKELGTQLLILLTFIAGGLSMKTNDASSEVSEELKIVAYNCLETLFSCYAQTPNAKDLAENIGAIGHAVTVLLSGVTSGASKDVQLSALAALDAFLLFINDKEALASFLPGITSSLVKTLQQDSRSPWRVLKASLNLLSTLLEAILNDGQVEEFLKSSDKPGKASDGETPLNESWLKATAGQVKIALRSAVKLQYHQRLEVQQALLDLCRVILEKCRKSLADSTSMLVETIIGISWKQSADDKSKSEQVLYHLATVDNSVMDSIKSGLHGWITSLPRVIQSNDDKAKEWLAHRISVATRILSDLGVESNVVGDLMANNLRDSVSAVIAGPRAELILVQSSGDSEVGQDLIFRNSNDYTSQMFQPVFVAQKSQQETLGQLQVLLKQLSQSTWAPTISRNMLDHLQIASGDERLACFWLTLNTLRDGITKDVVFDRFTSLGSSTSDSWLEVLEELYSYSLSLLLTPWKDQQEDWRLQSMALETVALQAEHLKSDFRLELIETLYPVVHAVGSSEPQLQRHAILCLNIIAQACNYQSASDLIIQNVDYLVNAVALKLNMFDISPQAPQVLLMMIKLAGPSLLPYLDDLVDSIFAALDNFHGYPRLVELLFSVLREIVSEGSKSDVLKPTSGSETEHRKQPYRPRTVEEVAALLSDYSQRMKIHNDERNTPNEHEPFPQEPWQSSTSDPDPSGGDQPDEPPTPNALTTPPQSKTYHLLHRITQLTQHYLTHPSPTLRLSLLQLTRTSFVLLQRYPDTFLPLIHTLWPVLIARLYDPETYISISASQTLGQLCRSAGDFLRTRFETEWGELRRFFWRVHGRLRAEKGRGMQFTHAYQTWDALVGLLLAVVEYVGVVDDVMADDLLEMLGGELGRREDVRTVLERWDRDAVWLEMQMRLRGGEGEVGMDKEMEMKKGKGMLGPAARERETPVLDGWRFRSLELEG
ncbi:MAG: hypothetical protein M1816_001918 [Peltula sp. TS41687]|nr:MAG: hypothetical protein M1816_001918 [Peltula sp. TS41687]